MRAAVTAFPGDIREDFGKTSLIAMHNVVPLGGFPALTGSWFYVEVDLDPAELGRDVSFEVEVQDPDGGTCVLDRHAVMAPAALAENHLMPLWGLRFELNFTVRAPGPHLFQLRADGQIVTQRVLHFVRDVA